MLPGSRSEIWGHPDWRDNWAERTAAYDALIDHFKLKPSDLVLRCHPHWGEKIGRTDGKMPEDYYTNWARKRGVLCIASTATASTMSLIEQSDAAVVSGSAALEAGALGKQVMALAPCWYQNAGFQTTLYGAEDLAGQTLDKDRTPEERAILARERQKHTLRFLYTIAHRFAQFVPYVRCESTTHYSYFEGADPDRLIRLMRTGVLEPDDAFRAPDDREENEILDLIAARAWEKLINPPPKPSLSVLAINRRFPYQALDWLRAKLRRGDL